MTYSTTPSIVTLSQKKLIGLHVTMSLANNKTAELWSNFMPRRKEVKQTIDSNLFSMQVYPAGYNFSDLSATFEKWAAVEVIDTATIPEGMTYFILPQGLYAVFHYKGLSTNPEIFRYIFGTWLPESSYVIDDRPHFEILGEKYKNNDASSEEEIWIPIKSKR